MCNDGEGVVFDSPKGQIKVFSDAYGFWGDHKAGSGSLEGRDQMKRNCEQAVFYDHLSLSQGWEQLV